MSWDLEQLIAAAETHWGLGLLALIAFSDTLIGVGFFVFGEVAFLAAGAILAASGAVLPAIVVVAAGWCGDLASYTLGRHVPPRVTGHLLTTPNRRSVWRSVRGSLVKRGALFVVMSRFLGPTAWVTPFAAGVARIPALTFVWSSLLGASLGIGQFLVLGALGANIWSMVGPYVLAHFWAILTGLALLGCAALVWWRCKTGILSKLLRSTGASLALFALINATYFFVLNTHSVQSAGAQEFQSLCDASTAPLLVTPGETSLHLPQPVNVLYLSPAPAENLMVALGWQQNKTFSHDEIGFLTYLRLMWNNIPPVSELYLSGAPADSAFQLPGSWKSREHIRWWSAGAFSVGAISKDEEIAIKYYRHLPVILHDIDPKVDLSRDLLAAQARSSPAYQVVGYSHIGTAVPDDTSSDFLTDGRLLVLADADQDIPRGVLTCLAIEPVVDTSNAIYLTISPDRR